ncbi:MAG: chaperone NapD [Candidatus Sedimenticola endophacoides]
MRNICSAIVHARPEKAARVRQAIEAFEGVEVHGGVEEGKLIVMVEGSEDDVLADTLGRVGDLQGVVSTVMIYHFCGEDEVSSKEVLQ